MQIIDLEHYQTIPFTDEQLSKMCELYAEGGKSMRQLSAIYGISQLSISRRLNALGIEKRRKGRYVEVTQDVIDRALSLREEGLLWREIAPKLGMNRNYISKVIREYLNEKALPV